MRILIILCLSVLPLLSLGAAKKPKHVWMDVTAYAYCPCFKCCGKNPGHPAYAITFKGTDAWKAGIAVDQSVIPHGRRVDIPGYERGVNKNGSWILADDTGGSKIRGKVIDVRFVTHKEALQWGVKHIRIRVWETK